MRSGGRFSVDPRRVVHETIDGETIIIQLETGTYYSLGGSAADIWELVAKGLSIDEVVDQLGHTYEESSDRLAEATADLVRELVQEDLVQDADGDAVAPLPAVNGNGDRPAFQPPTLQKYTDMQYFLLLDPIHEVEDAGWPHQKEQGAA
jgi:hypothetical protein